MDVLAMASAISKGWFDSLECLLAAPIDPKTREQYALVSPDTKIVVPVELLGRNPGPARVAATMAVNNAFKFSHRPMGVSLLYRDSSTPMNTYHAGISFDAAMPPDLPALSSIVCDPVGVANNYSKRKPSHYTGYEFVFALNSLRRNDMMAHTWHEMMSQRLMTFVYRGMEDLIEHYVMKMDASENPFHGDGRDRGVISRDIAAGKIYVQDAGCVVLYNEKTEDVRVRPSFVVNYNLTFMDKKGRECTSRLAEDDDHERAAASYL